MPAPFRLHTSTFPLPYLMLTKQTSVETLKVVVDSLKKGAVNNKPARRHDFLNEKYSA